MEEIRVFLRHTLAMKIDIFSFFCSILLYEQQVVWFLRKEMTFQNDFIWSLKHFQEFSRIFQKFEIHFYLFLHLAIWRLIIRPICHYSLFSRISHHIA